jgi:hypothetical protein
MGRPRRDERHEFTWAEALEYATSYAEARGCRYRVFKSARWGWTWIRI